MKSPEEKERRKKEREKERDEYLSKIDKGTILYTSWGYEQTNVEFFRVEEKKNTTLTLREIGSRQLEETGPFSAQVTADPDSAGGEPFKKIVRSGYASLGNGYRYLYVWDGKPMHSSWGH